MSLYSTYVPADDGAFYLDPILTDAPTDWFLCFDDEDPPELVVRLHETTRLPVVAFETLCSRLGVRRLRDGHESLRLIPPDVSSPFKPARSVFVSFSDPIPVPLIWQHAGRHDEPRGTYALYLPRPT